jgi:hypothetical protein
MKPYSAAVLSPCEVHGSSCTLTGIDHPRLYRYELIRRWGDDPMLEFVMLNPSTADAHQDDPTIRRCIGFAKRWGYGALLVRNLYAYRATDPSMLVNVADPIGPANRDYLGNRIAHCTIAAWGAHPAATGWWNGYPYDITKAVTRKNLYCLGRTSSGAPRHPLYVKGDTTPTRWDATAFITGQLQERI